MRELAERAGLPRSTAHRLARELEEWGGLERVEDGLRPGLRLFELGQRAPRQRDLREAALPAMRDVHAATGRLVQLAVLDGDETVCVEQVVPRGEPRVPSRPGTRVPAHATAMGKVLLACAVDPAALDVLLARPLAGLTRRTITDPAVLRPHLAEVRALGHALNRGEGQRGLLGIAVPLRDDDSVIAALSISFRAQTDLERALVALKTAQPSIERALAASRRSPR